VLLRIATLIALFFTGTALAEPPCWDDHDDYVKELDSHIDESLVGNVTVRFTAAPSFAREWGVRIFERSGETMLRVVQFKRSVWNGAYREIRPNVFGRVPTPAIYGRFTAEVPISPDTATLLRRIVANQVLDGGASYGFDGETYFLSVDGGCREIRTPAIGTSAEKFIKAFTLLRVQAFMPFRATQLFWERLARWQLFAVRGDTDMAGSEYWILAGFLILAVAVAALPVVVASIVMLIPHRLRFKRKFIVAAGALSYGYTCLVGVLLLPFLLMGLAISNMPNQQNMPRGFLYLADISGFLPEALLIVWIILSLSIPIYIRRTMWRRIPTP
jgi:hypothetical protein